MRPRGLLFTALCLLLLLSTGPPTPAWAERGSAAITPRQHSSKVPPLAQARLLLGKGKIQQSADAFELAHALCPNPADKALALVRLADLEGFHLGNPERALDLYARALREHRPQKNLENALFNAAILRRSQGNQKQAARLLQSYLRTFPIGSKVLAARYILEGMGFTRYNRPPKPVSGTEPEVRMLLARSNRIALYFAKGFQLVFPSGHTLPWPGGVVAVTARAGKILLNNDPTAPRVILEPKGGRFNHRGITHMGRIGLTAKGNQVLAVVHLPLEPYLEGVVAKEMTTAFELPALQAQAVAARSYAYSLLMSSAHKPWDVTTSIATQAYGGADAANVLTRLAVATTRGQILSYDGRPVQAFFHSHSGGTLEDDAEVWNSDQPYYKAQRDSPSLIYRHGLWRFRVTGKELASILRKQGYPVGSVSTVRALTRSDSGRMAIVRIMTDQGPLDIKANALRLMLGPNRMKSTLCNVERQMWDFVFTGKGHGHGVGMSQWGAQAMSENGSSYKTILRHYYPGTRLKKFYE